MKYDPLSIPEIKYNSPERCYFCKKYFFSEIIAFSRKKNIKYVMDGTNADDLKKYRPGLKAIQELGIRSPLSECGLTKAEIRMILRELNLTATAEKPASPCLATRFDYGMELTMEKISKIEKGESLIKTFLPNAKEIRLRQENDGTRIEVSPECIEELITHREPLFLELSRMGFSNITIDPQGYRSGSFDKFAHS
jgi:uncharacterized protein